MVAERLCAPRRRGQCRYGPQLAACLLVCLAGSCLLLAWPDTAMAAPGDLPLPGICSEGDRFGLWDNAARIAQYDVAGLHARWYTGFDLRADPHLPAGMAYVQTVRLSQEGSDGNRACAQCPTWDQVRKVAQKNPGSLWLIGNEPDRQDLVDARRYAELYHEFYTFLKSEDPSSQVAIGGVVQATPIRLQYLDQILASYQRRYRERMPVDVWNVHNYVIREATSGWGCGIPPGTDADLAIQYGPQDHDDLVYWAGHLTAMREWMRDQGYRDHPLILSEFGILMPSVYGYDFPRVQAFMQKAFDWLATATDASTGYPADGNRLVQAWAWFSLDDTGDAFEPLATWNHLFDPDSRDLTPLGLDYGAYAGPLSAPLPGSVDLLPVSIQPSLVGTSVSGQITTALTIEVRNDGGAQAGSSIIRLERDGKPAGEHALPAVAAGVTVSARILWPKLEPGLYTVTVEVNPARSIAECDLANNRMSRPLALGSSRIHLPLIRAEAHGGSIFCDGGIASGDLVRSRPKPRWCPLALGPIPGDICACIKNGRSLEPAVAKSR